MEKVIHNHLVKRVVSLCALPIYPLHMMVEQAAVGSPQGHKWVAPLNQLVPCMLQKLHKIHV